MVNNKDKPKPWHKRLFAKVTALAAAICMMLLPATAHADMQGVDMSNWQCGVDVYNMQADFIVVGTTWGTGQVNNNCLVSGVNTDANRMIYQAQASGKKFGLYHYAMGSSPEARPNSSTATPATIGVTASWRSTGRWTTTPHGATGIGYADSWRSANG